MQLDYKDYLDKVLGGWIGKSIGGALGARFEGIKAWIDLDFDEIIPDTIPPNDDLDLQVLWLKVLEEKGPALTSDDLAKAWLEGCWYPFNEYGNFRRNFRNGIKPPLTGKHDNQFYESGMGCPIRSEVWGYVFPGAPDLAAEYSWFDGTLDHTDESVCPEQMFAAMAADAFFNHDVRRLTEIHFHYLKPGLMVTKLIRAALDAHDQGLPLREARERLHLLGGHPEPCDAQLNVPFTFLALLYGEGDLEKTILAALQCGYDTDCTLATAGAFVGQIMGAAAMPKRLKDIIGDELVMGIEYRRKEMTLSALARDTANVGVKMATALKTGVGFVNAPKLKPFPNSIAKPQPRIAVDYHPEPAAAPGQQVSVDLTVKNAQAFVGNAHIVVRTPKTWTAVPDRIPLTLYPGVEPKVHVNLVAAADAPRWPQGHHFTATLVQNAKTVLQEPFGIAGSMSWRLLGVFFDPCKPNEKGEITREMILKREGMWGRHYFIDFNRNYIEEKAVAVDRRKADVKFDAMSRILGQPAVVHCPDSFIRPESLIGLRAEWVCYLDAEFFSPKAREGGLWMGSNDGYRMYFNGEMVKELDVQRWWTPGAWDANVRIKKGLNRMLLKLIKRADKIEFTLGIREKLATKEFPGRNDWITDLEWVNPLANG
ncbi:MAG: hypothetical protein A3K19_07625 [Lentisphaerae bacterium RIFOXYB12_FULL_65_16]|nr:MAG: hypothetical protein A3K18_07515 [Lentisphaerae bacterium RIFOXYA12_64_32]OGV87518.1 MAG: hypothetical protein A3K19_07625 [Lentisphaerae bacterium RIFOXYB12_FULL_65_16]